MEQIATHWMDDRKLVLTSTQRNSLGSDYQWAYDVPCILVNSKVTPLHKCTHCNGSGREPLHEYDRCDICGGSGGLTIGT